MIMKNIKNFCWMRFINFYSFLLKWILKSKLNHWQTLYFKAYCHTFTEFPENKLNVNSNIALLATQHILNGALDENSPNYSEAVRLSELLLNDNAIVSLIVNYHLVTHFYWSSSSALFPCDKQINESFEKAKSLNNLAKPFDGKTFTTINSQIKKELKYIKKTIIQLNNEKIENEKRKVITPVKISFSQLSLFVTSISTLFLVSGFIYNKILFHFLGASVGDFFGLSDYVSSSVDVISVTAGSTVITGTFFLMGWDSGVRNDIAADQFKTVRKNNDYLLLTFVTAISIYAVWHAYAFNEVNYEVILFLLFFVALASLKHAPWYLIENQKQIMFLTVLLITFSMNLGISIHKKISTIKDENYVGKYDVKFKEKNYKTKKYEFIASNSTYIFLWSKNENKLHIFPKSDIEAYEVK